MSEGPTRMERVKTVLRRFHGLSPHEADPPWLDSLAEHHCALADALAHDHTEGAQA